jgi:ubiquitin-like 1-activating enzyme E1 A
MATNNTTDATATIAATAATKQKESDVYDRQIRLWGAEAQKKIQNSKVLYLHVTGSSSEVLKNLCLAGIAATLCDPRPASALDSSPCFFAHPTNNNNNNEGDENPTKKQKIKYDSVAHAVRPLVEELNPLLGSCPIIMKDISTLTGEDLKDFAVVIASQVPLEETVRISKLVPDACIFYTIDCFGMRGASMIDLGGKEFEYRPEQGKKLLDPIPIKDYVSLPDMVEVPLHKAINRFHKKGPPPTWIMYRSLLEYQRQSKQWLGDDGDGGDDNANAKKIIQEFLKNEQVTMTDEELNDLVTAGMAQVAPVCAVLGGRVGNEIIKIISGKGEPANNTLLLDGGACKAWTFLVKAKE